MAETPQNTSGRRHAKKPGRRRKKRPGVDMTAMVDVAFLLLTFFVLTAMFGEAKRLDMVMPPNDAHEPIKILEDKFLTVLIDREDHLHYFEGSQDPDVHSTNFGSEGLRTVLLAHQSRYDPIVIIKPHKAASYGKLVAVLDELAIVKAPKFVMQDFSPVDSLLLATAH